MERTRDFRGTAGDGERPRDELPRVLLLLIHFFNSRRFSMENPRVSAESVFVMCVTCLLVGAPSKAVLPSVLCHHNLICREASAVLPAASDCASARMEPLCTKASPASNPARGPTMEIFCCISELSTSSAQTTCNQGVCQRSPWKSGCGGDCVCTHVFGFDGGLTWEEPAQL